MSRINNLAVIFDMDGVLVDNNPFHKQAWKTFCDQHGYELSTEQFEKHVFGRTNQDILDYLFQKRATKDEVVRYGEEKERIYREIFEPVMEPVAGLLPFLEELKSKGLPIGLATSAPPSNINFVLDHLKATSFFSVIVDETQIQKGKPDPEIYLKTCSLFGLPPSSCVVFEDSLSGIRSALDAGARVVALATTHSQEELDHADLVIQDFVGMSFDRIPPIR